MKRKAKTPLSYITLIVLFCIIAFLFALVLYPDITDVFVYLRAAIVGWIALILLALIGAIFIGMFLSHRILSIGGFTPFEEEMLKMRKDIEDINEKLNELIVRKNKDEEDGVEERGKDKKNDESD